MSSNPLHRDAVWHNGGIPLVAPWHLFFPVDASSWEDLVVVTSCSDDKLHNCSSDPQDSKTWIYQVMEPLQCKSPLNHLGIFDVFPKHLKIQNFKPLSKSKPRCMYVYTRCFSMSTLNLIRDINSYMSFSDSGIQESVAKYRSCP